MKIKYLAMAMMAIFATSCNDTDIDLFDSPAQDAGTGTLVLSKATISSLDFSWEAVSGVNQYGYALSNPEDKIVRQGVTTDTSIAFVNLERNTAYKFALEAYGANGSPTLVFAIDAATKDTEPLATPDMSQAEVTLAGNKLTITWPEVEHAYEYEYTVISDATGDVAAFGTTKTNSVSFRTLSKGDYELHLTAISNDPAYLNSATAVFKFTR